MGEDTSTFLTLNFDRTLFRDVFNSEEHEVCRNLVSGVVGLSSIFGFTAPLTSGIWYKQNSDGDFEEMLYGAVDISEMKSGSLYSFRYDINLAIDSMCFMRGASTVFNLRIHDLDIANAELKVCKRQFADGLRVDLFKYVPSLNDTSRINPDKIRWIDNRGSEIRNPRNHELKATEASQTSDVANFRMVYRYEVVSDCGPYSGNLYISAIDTMGVDTARKVIVCYSDDYAKHIDLFQVLGIAIDKDNEGHFIPCDVPIKGGKQRDLLDNIETTGIMNAYELFDRSKESETYTFCYLPSNNPCVSEKITVTIIVTKDIEREKEDNSTIYDHIE
jgi:hypothetical protein